MIVDTIIYLDGSEWAEIADLSKKNARTKKKADEMHNVDLNCFITVMVLYEFVK
jgi:hypothetical protein